MSITAMKTALEALEKCAVMIDGEWGSCRSLVEMDETDCLPQNVRGPITALRTAIAEAEKQEPVAWMFTDVEGTEFFEEREDWEGKWTPLYTTPPAAERNKLAAWMMARGYATGHGDSIEDLLQELDWQIAENWTRGMVNGVEAEREACAKVCEDKNTLLAWPTYAAAIRARGQDAA